MGEVLESVDQEPRRPLAELEGEGETADVVDGDGVREGFAENIGSTRITCPLAVSQ